MKIGLMGYGKMGKAIDQLLKEQSSTHEIAYRITSAKQENFNSEALAAADVIIEFTRPDAAVANIKRALDAGIPIVVGTTAWLDHLPEIKDYCEEKEGALLYAPNFSVGVNLFFELATKFSKLMRQFSDYSPSLSETHHTAKLDAPSGTAIHLAQLMLAELPSAEAWKLTNNKEKVDKNVLPVSAHRIEGVPGTHEISFDGEIDSISIKHIAHNRKGFAAGAILAARWLLGKKGVFTMKDVLRSDA